MASIKEQKDAIKNWEAVKALVSQNGTVSKNETNEQKQARISSLLGDYNEFCKYYFGHYMKNSKGDFIENAPFHTKLANDILKNEEYFGIIEWFRGSAKSVHTTIIIPIFLMLHKQLRFMLLVSANEDMAKMLLQGVQGELEYNERLIDDFGVQKGVGSWEEGFFTTSQNVSFRALGLGQSPRGSRVNEVRPDYIVIDDAETEERCRNPHRVKQAVDWILKALIGTMDIGFSRLLFVNNRISNHGILAKLVEKTKWNHSKVNALDEKGNITWKSKFTMSFFRQKKEKMGEEAFNQEYGNSPINSAGEFKDEFIVWKKPLENWLDYDQLVMYCDPAFSTSLNADFAAIKLWAKKGNELMCLKAYCRQGKGMEKALTWWSKFLQGLDKEVRRKIKLYCEGNATQQLLVKNSMEKIKTPFDLSFDTSKKGDKKDRISAMVPAYENGRVFYNLNEKLDPDMTAANMLLLSWSSGGTTHDDSPDADAGAWAKLEKGNRPTTKSKKFNKKYRY